MTRITVRRIRTALLGFGLLTASIGPGTVGIMAQDEGMAGIKGVKGVVLEPKMVEAKVTNCKVTAPGPYKTELGALIELSYIYPVALAPPHNATPKEVRLVFAGAGPNAVAESKLGIRQVLVPGLMGGAQIKAYLVAEASGTSAVEFMIDKQAYRYEFEVSR